MTIHKEQEMQNGYENIDFEIGGADEFQVLVVGAVRCSKTGRIGSSLNEK